MSSTLRRLNLNGNDHLNDNDPSDASAEAFSINDTLIELDLSRNNIIAPGASFLASNFPLHSLNLSENNMKDEGAIDIAGNQHIKNLTMDLNQIGEKEINSLNQNNPFIRYRNAKKVRANVPLPTLTQLQKWNYYYPNLKKLCLKNCDLSTTHMSELFSYLKNNPEIISLDIKGKEIYSEDHLNLNEITFPDSQTLNELNITDNNLNLKQE